MTEPIQLTPLGRWFVSLRPYSFTASLMPVAMAAALSVGTEGSWWTLPLFALAAVLFHAGTNVLNDYFDFRHGVDGPDDPDPTHAITQGIVTPRFMLLTGHIYFFLGVALGVPIAALRGAAYLLAGLAGALGAYFYTNARFSFKYVALGDPLVFLLMGPALVLMGVWGISGSAGTGEALHAVPMALLVTAILHGNNLRNRRSDADAGIRTLATLLGERKSRYLFELLLFFPVILLPLYAFALPLTPWVLLALPALFPAYRLAKEVRSAGSPEILVHLPMRVAQLHTLFSLLYVAGILVSRITG